MQWRHDERLDGALTDRMLDVHDLAPGSYRLRVATADGSQVGSAAVLIAR
ncbi:MAG: hypothetical protein JNL43_13170 [Flavobacteriales bacterium]|nr:hypothetical protein [Flavobacteriales bacterium]